MQGGTFMRCVAVMLMMATRRFLSTLYRFNMATWQRPAGMLASFFGKGFRFTSSWLEHHA